MVVLKKQYVSSVLKRSSICNLLAIQSQGGSTGENLLLNVPQESLYPGVQVSFENVQLEITMAASPCKTIQDSFTGGDFNQLSDKKYPGQTRWYARVLVEGTIHEGEQVTINSDA